MKCPFCGHLGDKVVDSRESREGEVIRRRRECQACGRRFTSYERIDEIPYMVVKKDGSRERFERQKVTSGMLKACEKRPVTVAAVEALADRVEAILQERPDKEIPTAEIGTFVMQELRRLDKVAYVRFASVYRPLPGRRRVHGRAAGSSRREGLRRGGLVGRPSAPPAISGAGVRAVSRRGLLSGWLGGRRRRRRRFPGQASGPYRGADACRVGWAAIGAVGDDGRATSPVRSRGDRDASSAGIRLSSTRRIVKSSMRRASAAAGGRAAAGTSPTISLLRTSTPCPAASRRTASNTRCSGVRSKSTRFIETCTTSGCAVLTPIALTASRPPSDARIVRAMPRATSRSPVSRLTLKAISRRRAPTAVAPPDGWGAAGPKSGRHSGRRIFPVRFSKPPRRIRSRRCRSGVRAACSYR